METICSLNMLWISTIQEEIGSNFFVMLVYLLSFFFVCVCVYIYCGYICHGACMDFTGQLGQLVLSSYCVDSGNLTQVTRLGSRCLSTLAHLTGSGHQARQQVPWHVGPSDWLLKFVFLKKNKKWLEVKKLMWSWSALVHLSSCWCHCDWSAESRKSQPCDPSHNWEWRYA